MRFVALALLLITVPAVAQEKRPGISVTVSGAFLNAGFAHPVEKTTPVELPYKKYLVSGTAELTGRMSFQPLPCADHVRLKMVMSGTAVGYDSAQIRCLRVHTIDRSRVCVQQEVFINRSGVRAGESTVSAPTVSEFQSASAGKPPLRDAIVRSLARSQFRFLPAKSNRMATEVSEIVLRQEIENDLPVLMGKANDRFQSQFMELLTGFEIPSEGLSFSSTADAIGLSIVVPDTMPTASPVLNNADVSLSIHESVLNRLARQMYGGSTQVGLEFERDLKRAMHLLGGPAPKDEPGAIPWSATFTKQDPITFHFHNSTLRIVLRGDEFEVGKEQHKAMSATIEYDIVADAAGIRAVRNRPINVTPPGLAPGATPTPRQQFLRGYLVAKFGQLLPKQLELSQLVLPEDLGAARTAKVSRVQAENGWLTLELRLP